jgi:hypothetical protein
MKEQKEKLIKRFENFYKLIPGTIEALSHLPDDGDLFTSLDPGELRVILPYDIPKYRIFRRKMGKNWVYKYRMFNEFLGCYHVNFEHKTTNINLKIDLELSLEGEHGCKLVVDYYEQAKPVYKVECK